MTESVVWGAPIACYLFLAGLAAGAYATAVLANFKSPEKTTKLQLVGRVAAPIILAVGLLLLMVDASAGIKNPGRFFLLVSNPASVMSWGVVILAVFEVIAIISAVLALRKRPAIKALDVIGLFGAFCTAAYTGVLIGVVKTYPLWNTALLPVLFVVSAFSAGLALVFLVSALVARSEANELHVLKRLQIALPVIEAILIVMLLLVTSSANPAALESATRLLSGDLAVPFWLGLVVVGLVLPFFLELIGSRRSLGANADSGSPAAAVIGGTGTLVGGFMMRYLIIFAAVPLVFVV